MDRKTRKFLQDTYSKFPCRTYWIPPHAKYSPGDKVKVDFGSVSKPDIVEAVIVKGYRFPSSCRLDVQLEDGILAAIHTSSITEKINQ